MIGCVGNIGCFIGLYLYYEVCCNGVVIDFLGFFNVGFKIILLF